MKGVKLMTVKEFRAVLDLVKNENAEIEFSTEPGVAYSIYGFDDDGESVWVNLDTKKWNEKRQHLVKSAKK